MKIKSGVAAAVGGDAPGVPSGWKDMPVYTIEGIQGGKLSNNNKKGRSDSVSSSVHKSTDSLVSKISHKIKYRWPHFLLFFSTITLILVVLFKWVALDFIIQKQIYQEVRLEEGTDTWNKWVNVPLPVFIRFHFFNITNYADFERGAKPKLQEVGPYTYEERRFKKILDIDNEQDTVRYRQPVYYFFRRDLSVGGEDDRVILINVPFVSVAKLSKERTSFPLAFTFTDRNLRDRGERLFTRYTIREYLFDGFSVQSYVNFLTNPMVQLFGSQPIPESFSGGKFGFYKGRNGSDDGEYVVSTGKRVPDEFGKIMSWDGKTRLEHFRGMCNMINGTDGSIFHPFIKKTDFLRFYNPEICRSMFLVYNKELEFKGIKGYRFQLPHPKIIFDHPDYCFCPAKDKGECLKQGVFSLAPCRDGAPVSFSAPHFYQSYGPYQDGVEGLHPSGEKHDTVVDVEPSTGMMLSAKKRLQFNIEVEPNPNMATFRQVPKVLLPFMWVEESVEIPDEMADEFKARLYEPVQMANKIAMGGLLVSAILIFVSILGCLWVTCHKRKDQVFAEGSERTNESYTPGISRAGSMKSVKSTSSHDCATQTGYDDVKNEKETMTIESYMTEHSK